MNNLSFLITRPNHDHVTNYLFYWTENIIKQAKKSGIRIFDLYKQKANKKNLNSYIKKNNPNIILFNGHGSEKEIAGFNDEILVEINKDEPLLKQRIVYSRSCKSAKELGVNCVKNGTKAFIGYKEDFVIITNPSKSTKPLEDKIAGFFLEPSNLVIKALLKGNSPKTSHVRSQQDSIKKMKYLMSSKATLEEKSLIPFLWRNMKAQVVINQET